MLYVLQDFSSAEDEEYSDIAAPLRPDLEDDQIAFSFIELPENPYDSDSGESQTGKFHQKPIRIPHVCPYCEMPQATLSVHFRGDCLKNSSNEEIHEVVNGTKKTTQFLLWHRRIVEFKDLQAMISNEGELCGMIEFLKKSGLNIHNVPPAFCSSKPMEVASPPASAEVAQPSTSGAAAPASK
ncbi:SAMTR protein, partial [Polypterus senegalus]